jgi:hypothetical protein
MNKHGRILCLAAVTILAATDPAAGALGISWWTIDGGGTTAASAGTLQLGGTIGQSDASVLAGAALILRGGFWMGGGVASAVPESQGDEAAPLAFSLSAGAPSPFDSETHLRLALPESRFVRASAFDPAGRLVRQLYAGLLPGGRHDLRWDGRGDQGRQLPNGVYLVRVDAGTDRATRRLVLLSR